MSAKWKADRKNLIILKIGFVNYYIGILLIWTNLFYFDGCQKHKECYIRNFTISNGNSNGNKSSKLPCI